MSHSLKPTLLGSLAFMSSCVADPAIEARGPADGTALIQALQACVESQRESDDFSGVVLLERAGALPFRQAYGLADPERGRSNSLDTPFNIGSLNKMFTAVAVGRLVDAGRMAFDDPVGRHLPDLPPEIARITLAQLLTHSGGLGEYFSPANRRRIAAARTARDLVPLVIEAGISFEPGSGRAYSNSGFVLLGAAIEAVSGQSYSEFVRTRILAPTGMSSTSFAAPPPQAARRLSRMTMQGPQPGAPRQPYDDLGSRASPAGGGYSTVSDLARFADAMRRDRIVSPRTKSALWTLRTLNQAQDAGQVRYGYGFGVNETEGTPVVGHNGGGPGVNAEGWWTVAPGWTLVVLSNYDPPAATIIARAARLMLSGEASPAAACEAARAESSRVRRPPGS